MILSILYLLTLYPICYNIYYYLILQQKWRDRNTFIFYFAAVSIIALRASNYLIYAFVDLNGLQNPQSYYSKSASDFATYCNLLLMFSLGVEQLDVTVRMPLVFVSGQAIKDTVELWIKYLNWFSFFFVLSATASFTYLLVLL